MRLLTVLSGDAANPCGWRRLTVEGEDESGAGGSAAATDESATTSETPPPTAQDEGEKTPSDTATEPDWQRNWSELKTRYDTEISSMRSRYHVLEAELEKMRQPDADRVDELDEQAELLARELSTIPNEDPKRIQKVYRNLLGVQDELAKRRAYQAVRQADTAERHHQAAEYETVQALKAAGLNETYLQDAYKEMYYLDARHPNWDDGMPQSQAIATMVDRVKASLARVQGRTQDIADANDKQKRSAAGVMGEGARVPRATSKEPVDDEPDSMMDQMKNLHKANLAQGQKLWSQLVARPK